MSSLITLSLLFFMAPLITTVAGKHYIVELNVVVDTLAYDYWSDSTGKTSDKDFEEEIRSTVFEASELYKTITDDDFNIRFVMKNLTLHAQGILSNPFGIIGPEGLTEFENWMYENKPFEKTDFDVAVLITGFDVGNEQTSNLYGFGRIGMVCTNRAVALVEFRSATYKNAFVLAHEIGHVLGANHDGTFDTHGRDCKPDGHVMTASTIPWSSNHFIFSYCSYSYFFYRFAQLPWECLNNGDSADYVQGKRLGTLMTADQACQRDLDANAFVSRAPYWIYGDKVCTDLECDKGNGDIIKIFSPQGLYCGKNKQCIQEKCVETDEGRSDVSDACPFGDQPKINYLGYRSCDDLPLAHCGVMKNVCCKRCALDEMEVADTMCRQKENNPKAELYRKAYVNRGYGDNFCKWLACTTGKRDGKDQWRWIKQTASRMICGKNKRCNDGRCLPAEDGLSYLFDGCPFGDQSSLDCRSLIEGYDDPSRACWTNNWGSACCAYCRGK